MNKLPGVFLFTLGLSLCLTAFFSYAQQADLNRSEKPNQQVVEFYQQVRYADAIPIAREIKAAPIAVVGIRFGGVGQCR